MEWSGLAAFATAVVTACAAAIRMGMQAAELARMRKEVRSLRRKVDACHRSRTRMMARGLPRRRP